MEHYVGLDVSLKLTAICVVDQTGSVVRGRGRGASYAKPGRSANRFLPWGFRKRHRNALHEVFG
jgi:hypothetical protein